MRSYDRERAEAAIAALRRDPAATARVARTLGLVETRTEPALVPARAWLGPFIPKGRGKRVSFERKASSSDRWRWADTASIPPKGRKRRVVYLGESVARGFFFDPAVTPAKMLGALLEVAEPGRYEVIDLASNDLTTYELRCLLEGVPALEPDVVVVFAGNNWMARNKVAHVSGERARKRAASAVRREGVAALARFAAQEIEESAKTVSRSIRTQLAALRVLGVVVVPEFNLAGWRAPSDEGTPWLHGNANGVWWTHARKQGRASAQAMCSLDRGSTSRTLALLADAEPARARRLLMRARDARLWQLDDQTPRCPAVVQEALRAMGGRGIRIVDLPELIAKEASGAPPDGRFFLDYCHMTKDGLALTVRAIAARILGGPAPEVPATALPSRVDDARAHFAAAIHNAHWGQEERVFGPQLDRALALHASARDWMMQYVEMQGRRAPPLLTESAGSLLMEQEQLGRFLLRYGLGRSFDRDLVDAMLARIGDDSVIRRVRVRRGNEWGVRSDGGEVQLLSAFFAPNQTSSSWPNEKRNWLRATTPRLELAVPVAESTDLAISVTARSSKFTRGDVAVSFNGHPVARIHLRRTWTTTTLAVPASRVRQGDDNVLSFDFSARFSGSDAITAAAEAIAAGRPFDALAAFADIHAVTASAAGLARSSK